ncbi:SRPBCC family protein [Kitasatospora sp. NPDC057500]|uniref:type II toxin-antitoxin system Rv0910 family toxin n=1 Tax=Kitasatospora sp. NPDC057500 TaxID=3346151 RepID=UPI00367D9EEE
MAKGISTIELAVTPEEAWQLLSDRARYAEWLSVHSGWQEESLPALEVGQSFTQLLKLMGPPSPVLWTVTAHEPGSRLELTGKGPTEVGARFAIEVGPAGAGSSVELVLELFGGPIDGALGKMIEPGLCTEMAKSLTNLAGLS